MVLISESKRYHPMRQGAYALSLTDAKLTMVSFGRKMQTECRNSLRSYIRPLRDKQRQVNGELTYYGQETTLDIKEVIFSSFLWSFGHKTLSITNTLCSSLTVTFLTDT